MDYNTIILDKSCVEWARYRPFDTDYLKYAETDPSVIAAAFKIEDVSYALSDARAAILFSHEKNYGDMSDGNELTNQYIKTFLLTNAVKSYAIALDMSWQVVWAYIQPASLEYLFNNEYKKMEKECDRDNLLAQLDCIISQGAPGFTEAERLKKIVVDFDNDKDVLKLRSLYNKIKHQGTIHFEGLGLNEETMMFSINGYAPKMLNRDSYSIQDIEELLVRYHTKFVKYFEKIISLVIPDGYMDKKMDFSNAIVSLANIKDRMDS